MADLVSSTEISDIVYEVTRDQLARKKNFLEILSNTLKVAGEFQVTIIYITQTIILHKVRNTLTSSYLISYLLKKIGIWIR